MSVIIKTGRFGELKVGDDELIHMPQGILGFPEQHRYCLVDPGDETLILWLQSVDHPLIAFPVLEPKVFKPNYAARLSASELRELKLDTVNHSVVFTILTIPGDVAQMSANLKAPLVINLRSQLAKQVVLQENEYAVKHPIFKELRAHLMTIQAQTAAGQSAAANRGADAASSEATGVFAVTLRNIAPSPTAVGLT